MSQHDLFDDSNPSLFVKDVRSQLKDKAAEATMFGFKTWKAFQEHVARSRENDYRRRHGRSAFQPHDGARPVERAQRVGSPAWHAWQNERRRSG